MKKIPFSILFLLLTCAACFGQSTYMGMTPGKSTRADIERILGQPVQSMSETLIQYKPRWDADKIYVQYQDDSAEAIVERIELICTEKAFDTSRCYSWLSAIQQKYRIDLSIPDAYQKIKDSKSEKVLSYFGSPLFMVNWTKYEMNNSHAWAFYSKELFENAAPKRGCTGAMFGDWETNLGRMTIERDGDPIVDDSGNFQQPIKGTYSKNKGTFTGTRSGSLDWKDDTGKGTMWMNVMLGADTLSGEWERDTGRGPKKGKLVGRCVEAGNGND